MTEHRVGTLHTNNVRNNVANTTSKFVLLLLLFYMFDFQFYYAPWDVTHITVKKKKKKNCKHVADRLYATRNIMNTG